MEKIQECKGGFPPPFFDWLGGLDLREPFLHFRLITPSR